MPDEVPTQPFPDDAPRPSMAPPPPAAAPRRGDDMRGRLARVWLLPFSVLALASIGVFGVSLWLDTRSAEKVPPLGELFTQFDHQAVGDVLGNVGQVVAQVLGVAISVVAIIVELAANRYTHKITELFFRAPVNFAVMGLFVVSGLDALWMSLLIRDGFVPFWGTMISMGLMSVSVLLLLPYFSFVFLFLNPMNVVGRIRAETLSVIREAPRRIALAKANAESVQAQAADGTEQLSDVALNAMSNHDGTIAVASVNALGDLARDYIDVKEALPLDWFIITDHVSGNPDFVSMAREVLENVGRDRSWFEFKLLRQFQTIYQGGLQGNRELCYVVSIRTRELAERAMEHGDPRVGELCIKFFNTFLRATVNHRDVRTAYNVLNQYRLLAETALRRGEGRFAIEIAQYFKYYGLLAFHMELGFALETCAYDLCALNELAFDLRAPERHELLKIFLEVDKEGEGRAREASLRGVRKAQVKLATYYLQAGDEAAAREVFRDMQHEQSERLASIRDELLAVSSPQFWEITDRGTNFDFMPPDRKRHLLRYFSWFGAALPPPPEKLVAAVSTASERPPRVSLAEEAAASAASTAMDASSSAE